MKNLALLYILFSFTVVSCSSIRTRNSIDKISMGAYLPVVDTVTKAAFIFVDHQNNVQPNIHFYFGGKSCISNALGYYELELSSGGKHSFVCIEPPCPDGFLINGWNTSTPGFRRYLDITEKKANYFIVRYTKDSRVRY